VAAVDLFVIFAPLFDRKAGNGFFIEKKASFRLSGRVNLDNLPSLHGYRKSSLPMKCLIAD
jgi:hypothetical protein